LAEISLKASLTKSTHFMRLNTQLLIFTLTRTILTTGFRMIYPFLPVLARAVGVNLETMALAATARSTIGLAGPVLGSTADRIGHKTAMLVGLGFFVGSTLLVVAWPTYIALLVSFSLSAVGKIIYDSAMQAYLGERVVYEQRSRAIAITEFGWSTSSLLGLPFVGWLIARSGWVAPFPLLAVLGGVFLVILWRILPPDQEEKKNSLTFIEAMRSILAHPSAMGGLAVGFLISSSNELVNIVFGAWLEDAFNLKVLELGATAFVIGLAELGGEGLTAGFTDRLGKRRAIGLGIALSAGACLLLPILGLNLTGALLGLFLFFIAFEFTFVSVISLMTELLPSARATLLSGNLAAAATGRALGAVVGPVLFRYGILANSITASALAAFSLLIVVFIIRVE
jgi:predicted MFS family arabinose efflux permease